MCAPCNQEDIHVATRVVFDKMNHMFDDRMGRSV